MWQGGHVKIHLNIKTPIQIDGEPTRFGPGEIVILKSALKVSILLFQFAGNGKFHDWSRKYAINEYGV